MNTQKEVKYSDLVKNKFPELFAPYIDGVSFEMNKHILILYSGGLDSKILERYAQVTNPNAKITKVWFDIGQEYNEKERACLDSSVEIRKIDYLRDVKGVSKDGNVCGSIMIPGRNAVLAMLGASIYLPDEIWMGAVKGEDNSGATDKNREFVRLFNDCIGYVLSPYKKVTLRFPFVETFKGKSEIVSWALRNGLSKEELMATSSCLSGEAGNCGTCIVCVRRWGIFYSLGFEEKYNNNLFSDKNAIDYLINVLIDDGSHYDEYRKREVIPALKKKFNVNNEDELLKILNDLKERCK